MALVSTGQASKPFTCPVRPRRHSRNTNRVEFQKCDGKRAALAELTDRQETDDSLELEIEHCSRAGLWPASERFPAQPSLTMYVRSRLIA